MLRRKIENILNTWKDDPRKKPLIIKGCRQCGKTWSVMDFAKKNYEQVVYLNFLQNNDYKSIFTGSLEINHITLMVSALLGQSIRFIPHKTVLIFDEIQECPEARTSLKFFSMDGRYDVIATGSLLGVKGYETQPASIPVGYESIVEMHPLDFEEFIWANGITDEMVDLLRNSFKNETPVPDALHNKLRQLFLEYAVVGGMPDVVQHYINDKNMNEVLNLQRNIISSYKDDMVKYASKQDKGKIRDCFESIPNQLSKENKKFQFSVIKKGSNSASYLGCLQWLEDAGIISRCYNLSIIDLPLAGNAMQNVFKVYMQDSGLFISMLEDGTQFDVLNGNLYAYKGAVFENLVAEIFTKMGRKLYFYHKESSLEIDFIIRYKSEATLVEVKATTGNTKSSKTVLSHPEKYHVSKLIKLGNYNVGRVDNTLTLPNYMAFLLTEY